MHGFEHATVVDPVLSCAICKDLSDGQRGLLRLLQTGAAITNEVRRHWTQGIDETCPLCDEKDGPDHMFYMCPGRTTAYADTPVPALQELPPLLRRLGIAEMHPELSLLHDALLDQPARAVPLLASTPNQPRRLFPDGSARFPNEPRWRVAAFGIVDADDQAFSWRCPLPGSLQSSGRAEIAAGLACIQLAMHVCIFSDYAVFVNGLQCILDGVPAFTPSTPNVDLWRQIAELVASRPIGAIAVRKVKAHNEAKATTDQERWESKHICRADKAAKEANGLRPGELWALHERLRSETFSQERAVRQVQRRQLRVMQDESTRIAKYKRAQPSQVQEHDLSLLEQQLLQTQPSAQFLLYSRKQTCHQCLAQLFMTKSLSG